VVVHSPLQSWAAARPANHPLAMMGRHSLPVFCTGLIISMTGVTLRQTGHTSIGFDLLYLAIGTGAQIGVAWLLTQAERRRGNRPAVAPANSAVLPS
jgi:hypothetical protein